MIYCSVDIFVLASSEGSFSKIVTCVMDACVISFSSNLETF